MNQLKFYNDLRKENGLVRATGATQSTKQFDVIPTVDRERFPSFIKKVTLKLFSKIYIRSILEKMKLRVHLMEPKISSHTQIK